MGWPVNTSNRVVTAFLGDPGTLASSSAAITREKLEARMGSRQLNDTKIDQLYSNITRLRTFPTDLNKTIRLMYGSKCREHNHINNNQHLVSAHQCRDILEIARELENARDPGDTQRLDAELNRTLTLLTRLSKN